MHSHIHTEGGEGECHLGIQGDCKAFEFEPMRWMFFLMIETENLNTPNVVAYSSSLWIFGNKILDNFSNLAFCFFCENLILEMLFRKDLSAHIFIFTCPFYHFLWLAACGGFIDGIILL